MNVDRSAMKAEPNPRPGDDILIRADEGAVVKLTLNRPQARNSLSLELIRALHAAFDDCAASPDVKVVVLAASGEAFCAGHDIRELQAHRTDADAGRAFFERAVTASTAMMQAILACPKPVIAAVQGTATAAGCQLVATCDLAVAADTAAFCTPGVHIGLFCSTPAVALARNLGRKKAMEMLLLGNTIDAADACALGLVNKVVPNAELSAAAQDWAAQIASKSACALDIGKKAFNQQVTLPVGDAYQVAGRAMIENLMATDADEGLSAFLEKRPPRWSDR